MTIVNSGRPPNTLGDPEFATAWAALAWVGSYFYTSESPKPEIAERVRVAAEKAIELAPQAAASYNAMGSYLWFVLGDYRGGLEQLSKGRRLDPSNADILNSMAAIEMNVGRWQVAAVEHLRESERLDPRSADPIIFLGQVLMELRRPLEARQVLDRGLSLRPDMLTLIMMKATRFLNQGDLGGARRVLRTALNKTDPTALVASTASFMGVWLLDEAQRAVLLRLTPASFPDRGDWALCLTEGYWLGGDEEKARTYADEARGQFEERVRAAPQLAWNHAFLGRALAYLGQKDEAIREGERAIALAPAKDGLIGKGSRGNLALIYIILGEPERALDLIERLLEDPTGLTPALLRISPDYDPLRQNPRFQKLVAGK